MAKKYLAMTYVPNAYRPQLRFHDWRYTIILMTIFSIIYIFLYLGTSI